MPKRTARSAVESAVWPRKAMICRRGGEASAANTRFRGLTIMLIVYRFFMIECRCPFERNAFHGESKGGHTPLDGRPGRLDLVRRQAGAVALGDHARAHALAALRPRCLRGRARLQDGERHADLPAARAHAAAAQLRAYLHD